MIVIKKANLHDFSNHMNLIHPKRRFTIENKSDGCLPFLDIFLERNSNGSISILYRKPTHTDQYLNFVKYKSCGHFRDIVSDSKDLRKANTIIVNALMDNNYRKGTIMKVEKRMEKGKANEGDGR